MDHNDGALIVLDLTIGEELWSWAKDGPGYASPVVHTVGGARHLVTQTQRHVLGLDLETGAPIWRLPFSTAYDQNSVTPLPLAGMVLISGLEKGTRALTIERNGKWSATTAWENDDVSMYMSSPVSADGLVFGLDHKRRSRLFCIDAGTGETSWGSVSWSRTRPTFTPGVFHRSCFRHRQNAGDSTQTLPVPALAAPSQHLARRKTPLLFFLSAGPIRDGCMG